MVNHPVTGTSTIEPLQEQLVPELHSPPPDVSVEQANG
jgi:hypothetical protein